MNYSARTCNDALKHYNSIVINVMVSTRKIANNEHEDKESPIRSWLTFSSFSSSSWVSPHQWVAGVAGFGGCPPMAGWGRGLGVHSHLPPLPPPPPLCHSHPHLQIQWGSTVQCCYVLNFLLYSRNRHPTGECLLWVEILISILLQSLQWCMQYDIILNCAIMAPDCTFESHYELYIFFLKILTTEE